MTGNPEIIRQNVRYYERLLTSDSVTYTREQARLLLDAAKARLSGTQTEASKPTA